MYVELKMVWQKMSGLRCWRVEGENQAWLKKGRCDKHSRSPIYINTIALHHVVCRVSVNKVTLTRFCPPHLKESNIHVMYR